jgi:hypothetical protein
LTPLDEVHLRKSILQFNVHLIQDLSLLSKLNNDMNVRVNVPQGLNMESVESFISKMNFENLSVRQNEEPSSDAASPQNEDDQYCIEVTDTLNKIEPISLESMLESGKCSLLIFNHDVDNLKEPKVVFATDHSNQASKNLNRFKQLKPTGFSGATVISLTDSVNLGTSLQETSRIFLERTNSAAHSIQANLIIANFDLGNMDRKPMQMSNLVNIVLQNKCHVLIL